VCRAGLAQYRGSPPFVASRRGGPPTRGRSRVRALVRREPRRAGRDARRMARPQDAVAAPVEDAGWG